MTVVDALMHPVKGGVRPHFVSTEFKMCGVCVQWSPTPLQRRPYIHLENSLRPPPNSMGELRSFRRRYIMLCNLSRQNQKMGVAVRDSPDYEDLEAFTQHRCWGLFYTSPSCFVGTPIVQSVTRETCSWTPNLVVQLPGLCWSCVPPAFDRTPVSFSTAPYHQLPSP